MPAGKGSPYLLLTCSRVIPTMRPRGQGMVHQLSIMTAVTSMAQPSVMTRKRRRTFLNQTGIGLPCIR